MRIAPDGTQKLITQTFDKNFTEAEDDASRFTEGTLPNGLAFAGNGDILISNFGTDVLEVMTRLGETRLMYDTIDGQPIGKVNFVLRDSQDRIWLTISTRTKNWMKTVSPNISDGYIALADETGRTYGAHLLAGCLIFTTAELVIGTLPGLRFLRTHDPQTGYSELDIQP